MTVRDQLQAVFNLHARAIGVYVVFIIAALISTPLVVGLLL